NRRSRTMLFVRFLRRVGIQYDLSRGFTPFSGRVHMHEVRAFFGDKCCYCGRAVAVGWTKDHLIPINKTSCGLHAWGNVVSCCRECNALKHYGAWTEYVKNMTI